MHGGFVEDAVREFCGGFVLRESADGFFVCLDRNAGA